MIPTESSFLVIVVILVGSPGLLLKAGAEWESFILSDKRLMAGIEEKHTVIADRGVV